MTKSITVFSGPTCAPCTVAKNRLIAAGVPFEDVDLSEHPDVLAELKRRLDVPKINTPLIRWGTEHVQINELSRVISEYQSQEAAA